MIDQSLFNLIVGVAGLLGGWIMKIMWDSLKDLRKTDKELAEKVGEMEVLVAGTYVKREDLDKLADAIFRKLDRIENKVDGKQDRV